MRSAACGVGPGASLTTKVGAPHSFTVAIPTHDRRELVLAAVRSALTQTRPPMQVVVVADGCTDGTSEAVRDLGDERIEVLDLPKGPGRGYEHRNEAARRARGTVISWLSDDDLYAPDHLEHLGELFDAGGVDLVQAMSAVVTPDGALAPLGMDWRVPHYRELFLGGQSRTPSSAVSHLVELLPLAGGWRDDRTWGADMDLWQRMLRDGARPAMLAIPTVLHFKATGRTQDYEERVAQNLDHLARLERRDELIRMRSRLWEMVQERAGEAEAERERNLVEHDKRQATLSGQRAKIDALRKRVRRERTKAAAAHARLAREQAGRPRTIRSRIAAFAVASVRVIRLLAKGGPGRRQSGRQGGTTTRRVRSNRRR